jgi:hypothetical protein
MKFSHISFQFQPQSMSKVTLRTVFKVARS